MKNFDQLITTAAIQFSENRFQEAVVSYTQLAKLMPKNPEICLNLGVAQKACGNFNDAKKN